MYSAQDKSKPIYSGHFMMSSVDDQEEEEEDVDGTVDISARWEESEVGTYQPGISFQGDSKDLPSDGSLERLFECMSVAYSGKIASPKWKNFKGIKVRVREKVRLNNIIWREWHMQFVQGRKAKNCKFELPFTDAHSKPEAVVLEGKYWKRQAQSVKMEYKKWRVFFRNLPSRDRENHAELLERVAQTDFLHNGRAVPLPSLNDDAFTFEDDTMDFSDDIFDNLHHPFPFPDPRELAQSGAFSGVMQPGLIQLQPNLMDDFMDYEELFGPLCENIKSDPLLSNDISTMNSLMPDNSTTINRSSSVTLPAFAVESLSQSPSLSPCKSSPSNSLLFLDHSPISQDSLASNMCHIEETKPMIEPEVDFLTHRYEPVGANNVQEMSSHTNHIASSTVNDSINDGRQLFLVSSSIHQPITFMQSIIQPEVPEVAGQHKALVVNQTSSATATPYKRTLQTPGHQTQRRLLPVSSQPDEGNQYKSLQAILSMPIKQELKGSTLSLPSQLATHAVASNPPVQSKTNSDSSMVLAQLLSSSSESHPKLNGKLRSLHKAVAAPPKANSQSKVQLEGNSKCALAVKKRSNSGPKRKTATSTAAFNFQKAQPLQMNFSSTTSITPLQASTREFSRREIQPAPPFHSTSSPPQISHRPRIDGSSHMTLSEILSDSSSGSLVQSSEQRSADVRVPDVPSFSSRDTADFADFLKDGNESNSSFEVPSEFSADEKPSQRRVVHLSSEQKRRCNIKVGFETLHELVPSLNSATKISKATALQKTADYCRKLKKEREMLNKDIEALKLESEHLSNAISLSQSQLPCSGVSVAGGCNKFMQELYQEYEKAKIQSNWKFYVFSCFISKLLDSYSGSVSTANSRDFSRTLHSWLEQHCSLVILRPTILEALRQLSTQTSVLSDPSKLRVEAYEAISKSSTSACPTTSNST